MDWSKLRVSVPLVLVLLLSACAPTSPSARPTGGGAPDSSAASNQTLVIAVRGEPPSVASKPVVDFSGSLGRPRELFNANLDFLDERERPQPQLAESLPQLNTDTWRVFPDGRMETTYRLKPNLTWHDGTPLTAEDFVFAHRVYSTREFGHASSPPVGQMDEVLAPDARTVVIRWKQPYPEAAALDHDFQALPRHILAGPFQELDPIAFSGLPFWSSEYVGLGPYRVTAWEPGAFITGEAFAGYALGRPKIDEIRIALGITDPQTAAANLMAGEVHFIADPLLSEAQAQTMEQGWVQNGEGKLLYSTVALRTSVVQLRPEHVETPALLNATVRRAIASGMNAAGAVDALTGGKGLLTHTITSPGAEFYPEIERVIQKHPYDIRRVQQLMEEAGYARGGDGIYVGRDGQRVGFSVASSSGRNEMETAIYVDGLRKAGFEATQRVVPAQQIRDPELRALLPGLQVRGGGEELITYTSEQIPGANNRWHGDNRGGWSNPEFDAAFLTFTTTLDRPDRIKQIAQMERIISEQVPAIPHFFNVYVVGHVNELKGPVARHTPLAGGSFLHVHTWEWMP
jgi:peptide/nickel transport system substrate-binding protein